jgi:hypothetical protein
MHALLLPLLLACGDKPEDTQAPQAEDTGPADTTEAEPPSAACAVSPAVVAPPFEEAVLVSTGSTPGDSPIAEYQWSLLSQPDGSAVAVQGDRLTPDLGGDYELQLVVVDEDGRESAPCNTELRSAPSQALWIELYWDLSQDDMDLHLLAPGGTLETDTDCYYANCVGGGLDWGVLGDDTDNPSLDLDDVPGTGPENINIDQPSDGVYEVWVHDYRGSNSGGNADPEERNTTTINIWLNGSQAFSLTKHIEGEDVYTPFVEISMPDGRVVGL